MVYEMVLHKSVQGFLIVYLHTFLIPIYHKLAG